MAVLQPGRSLCVEEGGHPQLASGRGSRPPPLGCECSRKASSRWGCSGLFLHPSHPTASCCLLPTCNPRNHTPVVPTSLIHNPPPRTRTKLVSSFVFLLHLQETELWLSARKHHHPFPQITTVTTSFILTLIQTQLCAPYLPDISRFPLFWHEAVASSSAEFP